MTKIVITFDSLTLYGILITRIDNISDRNFAF